MFLLFQIPVLIPGLNYQYEFTIESIDPLGALFSCWFGADVSDEYLVGAAEAIRVFACNPKSVVPIIAAIGELACCDILLSSPVHCSEHARKRIVGERAVVCAFALLRDAFLPFLQEIKRADF